MSERIVHKIEKHQYANFGKKTVVIYARVSTNKPSQLHSMAMQVSALTQQVYRLWHWQLADIYIDFESGASDDRSEFQRMINDCISKRYNMVLTKSVSRFGRDTLDGLNAIRKLKQHGVEVYFDLEELKSFQPDFELHYSIRAAIAILDGTSSIYSRPCYGYRKSEDGSLLIVPEEAETVRLIFNLYLSGYSIIGIIHELESRSISSPTGKPKWCRRAIDTLLSNEKYRGGSTATTVLMSDAPQSKQRARYLFSDHHEAIIDEKTFIAVAKEKQRRCNIEVDENGVHRKKTRYTAKIRVSGSLKEE